MNIYQGSRWHPIPDDVGVRVANSPDAIPKLSPTAAKTRRQRLEATGAIVAKSREWHRNSTRSLLNGKAKAQQGGSQKPLSLISQLSTSFFWRGEKHRQKKKVCLSGIRYRDKGARNPERPRRASE